jgi:hypothetical protein
MIPSRAAAMLGPIPPTVAEALLSVVRDPIGRLIRDWNWKSALTSTVLRAPIFFFVNLAAGPRLPPAPCSPNFFCGPSRPDSTAH